MVSYGDDMRQCMCKCFELCLRYDFSWFKAIMEVERVLASEGCGQLMIGNNHEKNLISLLETLKDTAESQ